VSISYQVVLTATTGIVATATTTIMLDEKYFFKDNYKQEKTYAFFLIGIVRDEIERIR